MLTLRQRSALAAQPIRVKNVKRRGWIYFRQRMRAEEFYALVALADVLGTAPLNSRMFGQSRVGTLVRAIGRGFLGLYNAETGFRARSAQLPVETEFRHKRIKDWKAGL